MVQSHLDAGEVLVFITPVVRLWVAIADSVSEGIMQTTRTLAGALDCIPHSDGLVVPIIVSLVLAVTWAGEVL